MKELCGIGMCYILISETITCVYIYVCVCVCVCFYICIYHTSPNDTLKIAGFCYRCTLNSEKFKGNVPILP